MSKQDIINQLLATRGWLLSSRGVAARNALLARNYKCDHAYITHSVPEQNEDIYEIVFGDAQIVTIEVERDSGKIIYISDAHIVNDYLKGKTLSKIHKRKILLAAELCITEGLNR